MAESEQWSGQTVQKPSPSLAVAAAGQWPLDMAAGRHQTPPAPHVCASDRLPLAGSLGLTEGGRRASSRRLSALGRLPSHQPLRPFDVPKSGEIWCCAVDLD